MGVFWIHIDNKYRSYECDYQLSLGTLLNKAITESEILEAKKRITNDREELKGSSGKLSDNAHTRDTALIQQLNLLCPDTWVQEQSLEEMDIY